MSASASDFARKRQTMVECQIRTFDVTDQPLLQRFFDVPREIFVGAENQAAAYSDSLLTVRGEGARAMLRPLVLARLLQGARIERSDRVLVGGGGAGYSAAIVAGLANEVVALESDARLADAAKANLDSLGFANVQVVVGPLEQGVKDGAGFSLIVFEGAIEVEPTALLAQLREDGRLVAIVHEASDPTGQAAKAILFERSGAQIGHRQLFSAFAAPVLTGFARAQEFAF